MPDGFMIRTRHGLGARAPRATMNSSPIRTLVAATFASALTVGLAVPSDARAQSAESEPAPPPGGFEPAPLPPQDDPLVPDVPDAVAEKLREVRARKGGTYTQQEVKQIVEAEKPGFFKRLFGGR